MSFVFSWDKLDDEVALQIEGMIHAHFQRITKPSFMGNIAVSKFRFGSTPPNITVLDVTDPLEEWYVHMDQEEARLAQEAAEAGGGESLDEDELASGDEGEYEDEYSYSDDGSVVMVGEGDDIEYLGPGSFDDREHLETEGWMHRQQRQRHSHRNDGSSSSDSFRDELKVNKRPTGPYSDRRGSISEQDVSASARDHHHHHFRSAVTSPTKISPSSPSSSTSSLNSFGGSSSPLNRQKTELEGVSYKQTSKRNARNLKLDIDNNRDAPSQGYFVSTSDLPETPSPKESGTTLSLSSHASDEDIESEAFYTQGESTIFQRMKNLVLEPSILMSSRPASADGGSPKIRHSDQPQLAASALPPTSPSIVGGGSLGLGLGTGIGSPGTVLSTVMQNRTTTRPLSVTSFYSSPTSATASSSGQLGQMTFPDLSNMVVSGNSFLGLRAGTASKTIPSTPRGFESPTLVYSRRQSFSEIGRDDHISNVATTDRPGSVPSELHSREQEHLHSAFMSPVEALNFEALSRQPKVVERFKDPEDTTGGNGSRNGSQSGRSHLGDQRSRSSSIRHGNERHPMRSDRPGVDVERRRRRKKQRDPRNRYEQGDPVIPSSYPLSPPAPSKRHENDIQLLLSVNYQGQMGFTVETEILLNYPTFAFLALPVKLVITGFSFKAKVLMGYLRNHVNVCFLEPEDPNESILSNVRIESQVGDEQKQAVLKNVGKIERFVVEQLRKFITEDFVYPSYHSIELLRAPPPTPSTPPQPPTNSRSGFPEPNASSSRGVSASCSSTTASVTNHTSSNAPAPRSIDDSMSSSASSIRARSHTLPLGSSATLNHRRH
ncbi:Mitochondrial distribution and morphology protein 12 [Mortierella sp. AD011]|nr:Mitochondrial distribution and morphology protein 12 [Mortierella sp. AD010]KAF9398385.1 Mitochondrial distribution and morphology protein 12 [Mortierella sp. AD011]